MGHNQRHLMLVCGNELDSTSYCHISYKLADLNWFPLLSQLPMASPQQDPATQLNDSVLRLNALFLACFF